MMPMAAACLRLKPSIAAMTMVAKMPNWAAAPNSMAIGRRISGEKSHIAPMAMKMSTGNSSL